MHPGESSKRAVPPALGSRGSIDSLPDCVLEHILGFLLAPEAVRTCVLARRWRHLWMSAPCLRVGCLGDDVDPPPLEEYRDLVFRMLLRRGSPLDTFDMRLGMYRYDDIPVLNAWIWHVISCKVRLLALRSHSGRYLTLNDLPLVSKHLTRLELHGVWLGSSFLDFSSCPALEYIELLNCNLYMAKDISSNSLKHLIIKYSQFNYDPRVCIRVPNLVSLCLDGPRWSCPMLDSMPSLVVALIRITKGCWHTCNKLLDNSQCGCEYCTTSDNVGDDSYCMLLNGLSEAKDLELISSPESFIFKMDLRLCPTFNNLKTLVVNEYWCMPEDFTPLVCILGHSPVLEELTLELFCEDSKYEVEMEGRFSVERPTTISEHLNIVKVKCQDVDKRVLKVVKFLCTFNIRFSF